MAIIEGANAIYCGDPVALHNAYLSVKEFIGKAKRDPFFVVTLSAEEKEKYRANFETIETIFGFNDEEREYRKKL